MLNTFAAKFERLFDLTALESDGIRAIQIRPIYFTANQDLVREGDRATRCVIVLSGLACTSKVDETGKRQIAAFHISGDMPDLMGLHLEILDSDIRTVSECTVAFIDNSIIRKLCNHNPRLAAALWRETLIDASIFREWVNVGRRPALNRLAHLLCEVMRRMDAIGMADGLVCSFDLTQTDLSEATGLSVVHVNRQLQELRRRELITFVNGQLTVHNWAGLVGLAGFDEDYLHLAEAQHNQIN